MALSCSPRDSSMEATSKATPVRRGSISTALASSASTLAFSSRCRFAFARRTIRTASWLSSPLREYTASPRSEKSAGSSVDGSIPLWI